MHFGRDESVIGRIIAIVEDHIVKHCKASVFGQVGFHPTVVSRERLTHYAERIRASGQPAAVSQQLFGFIDGCHHEISRPGGNAAVQRAFYSGYIKGHAVTYHFVTAPDGIILNVYGPLQGRYNDINVLKQSRLLEVMQANPGSAGVPLLCLACLERVSGLCLSQICSHRQTDASCMSTETVSIQHRAISLHRSPVAQSLLHRCRDGIRRCPACESLLSGPLARYEQACCAGAFWMVMRQ
jgi:hypothetical protein